MLKSGLILYQLFNREYYLYKNKDNSLVTENKINSIIIQSLTYPELTDYSLSKGINIPFSINLPDDMLPSFEYSIKKATAYNRNYLRIKVKEFSLISQTSIIIKKPFKLLKELSFSVNKNENFLGFFNKGNLLLKANIEKNCIEFFEKIPIEIIIINDTNKNIDVIKLKVQLLRNINFKNAKDREPKDMMIINDILYNSEMSIDKQIEKNGKELKYKVDINFEEPESLFNTYIIEPVHLNYLDIKTKSDLIKLIPDINGDLFACQYQIKIECIYKSILKNENIYMDIPISVCHKNNIIKEKIDSFDLKDNKKNNTINSPQNNEEVKNKLIKEKYIKEIKNGKDEKEPNLYVNNNDYELYTPTNAGILPKVE